MIGIRIYGRAHFADIFAPILTTVAGLTWVITPFQPWRFPPEWEDASEFDPESGRYTSGPIAELGRDVHLVRDGARNLCHVAAVDIFPKYAAAVNDFGDSIFGVRVPPDDAAAWLLRTYWATPGSSDVDAAVREAEVSFVGHESWWEFYSRDGSRLDALKAHLLPARAWSQGAVSPLEAGWEECSSSHFHG